MWLIPLWTLGLALACFMFGQWMRKKPARLLAAGLAISALIPWLPSSHAEPPRKPSTQVVYRFDDHRHLELVGYGCEGAINYVDEKRGIHTPMIDQFAQVFLPPITHADDDGDFIFIPLDDLSAFRASKDRGNTFKSARWVGSRPNVRDVKAITVVNQQAFIETKDGRVFMTSKPFGEGWGMNVVDAINVLPETTLSDRPEFQNLPTTVPEVKNYPGWSQMRCDPDLEGEPKPTAGTRWNAFQQAVLDGLGRTVARPVTWLIEAAG
ncbi:MAG: hypothetical protein FHP94_20430 [Denitromonas halophila]|nr:MAG: hypothetical protein FHP94_20430 [Denitromonas halophila]